jgi:hypothetical protein
MEDWIEQARKAREVDHISKYGPISPKTDKRCFRREMLEELLDTLNYAEWAREKGELTRYQWRQISYNIAVTIHLIEIACEDRLWWRLEAPEGEKKIYEGKFLHSK